MAVEHLKSTSITNLDASPIVANTQGSGAGAYTKTSIDFATPVAANLVAGSTYQMVRLPFTAKVQWISLDADAALDTNAAPTLTFNVGAFFSDSTTDGTPAASQGTVINATAFASAVVVGRATALANVYALGGFAVAKRQQPLWQALGQASNPGGFVDIVLQVQGPAATGASANIGITVEYAE